MTDAELRELNRRVAEVLDDTDEARSLILQGVHFTRPPLEYGYSKHMPAAWRLIDWFLQRVPGGIYELSSDPRWRRAGMHPGCTHYCMLSEPLPSPEPADVNGFALYVSRGIPQAWMGAGDSMPVAICRAVLECAADLKSAPTSP